MDKTIVMSKIDREFLVCSRDWFSDRQFRLLNSATEFNKDEQIDWFNTLESRQDYRIWGVKVETNWIGACGLRNISREELSAEYWGYIFPSQYRGMGMGFQMFQFCKAQKELSEIRTLYLNVASSNLNAIQCYLRWGFVEKCNASAEQKRMEFQL